RSSAPGSRARSRSRRARGCAASRARRSRDRCRPRGGRGAALRTRINGGRDRGRALAAWQKPRGGCEPRGFYQRLIPMDRAAAGDVLVGHHRLELALGFVGGARTPRIALFLFLRELLLALGLLFLVRLEHRRALLLFLGRLLELLLGFLHPRLVGGVG